MIETGQLAPSISLMTDQGQFTLSEHIGKNVIIFFFPKADTSGCTKEAIAFSALQAEFEAANTLVIGISKDKAEKQAKFREKHNLTCLLGVQILTAMYVKLLGCGLKNPCMGANTWASSARPLLLMQMGALGVSGQR